MSMSIRLVLVLFATLVAASTQVYANGDQSTSEEAKESQAIEFLKNTEIHGTADVTYNYNFNRPSTGVNALRAFDTDPNSFSTNMFELAIQNQMTDWAQSRIDLDFGRDPRVYQAAGFADGDNFELEQAYLYLTAPIGNGLNFKVGKFVTAHGAEVIESAANYNASRGLLFTWAIPFTHTGVMADYTVNDYLGFGLGVLNGWDNVVDNNNGKTVMATVTVNPIPQKLSLALGGTVGPEQAGSDGNLRGLVDAILTWNALDTLTFVANVDLGKEESIGGSGFANWWGTAAYVHWKPTDLFGLTLRGEYFDEDTVAGIGLRTATAADKSGEGTITSHLYLFKGFDLRFEYRRDMTTNAIFAKADGSTVDHQDTFMTQAVYSF